MNKPNLEASQTYNILDQDEDNKQDSQQQQKQQQKKQQMIRGKAENKLEDIYKDTQQRDRTNEMRIYILQLKSQSHELTIKLNAALQNMRYLSCQGIQLSKQLLNYKQKISQKDAYILELQKDKKYLIQKNEKQKQISSKQFISKQFISKQLISKQQDNIHLIQQLEKYQEFDYYRIQPCHRLGCNFDFNAQEFDNMLTGNKKCQSINIKQIIQKYLQEIILNNKKQIQTNNQIAFEKKLCQILQNQKKNIIQIVKEFHSNNLIKQKFGDKQSVVKEEKGERKKFGEKVGENIKSFYSKLCFNRFTAKQ